MRSSRYADYPPEWDEEPDDVDLLHDLEPDDVDLLHDLEPDDVAVETPDGRPVDDLWHAQRAEDRDRFLHPPDPLHD